MAKLKYDFIDAHNGMRRYNAGDEAKDISAEGMAFLKENKYLVLGEDDEDEGITEAGTGTKLKVAELVELINKAATVEEVNEIVGEDDRKGVLTARDKKIEELNQA